MSTDLIPRLTECVRAADLAFESSGGSSRHWVRECLLPQLEAGHLAVVEALVPVHLASAERDVNSLAKKLDAADRLAAELLAALKKIDDLACRQSYSGNPEDLPEPLPLDNEEVVHICRAAIAKAGGGE